MSNLDLNNMPPDLQATLTKKETDGERRVRLIKDLTVFSLAIIVLVAAFIWAAITINSPSSSAGTKQTAGAIIIAIVGGMIGYLVKK